MQKSLYSSTKDFSLVLLAAGNSGRMNTPKPLLMFDNNRTFIEKILQEYAEAGCRKAFVTINEYNRLALQHLLVKCQNKFAMEIKIIVNTHPEYERFYSIKLAVSEAKETDICFIHDCDRPFINSTLIRNMAKTTFDGDYLIPVYNNIKGHPVVLKKKLMFFIAQESPNHENFRNILKNYKESLFEADSDDILKNINTLEDYKTYLMTNESC